MFRLLHEDIVFVLAGVHSTTEFVARPDRAVPLPAGGGPCKRLKRISDEQRLSSALHGLDSSDLPVAQAQAHTS
jgi:hypothetical protein